MKISREQAMTLSGGANFFKLDNGASALVRFLFNSDADIEPLSVHTVPVPTNKFGVLVDCGRLPSDPIDNCKWCAQGLSVVSRIVLPIWNVNNNRIEYWTRSAKWVENQLLTIVNEYVKNGEPISGLTFKIIRNGVGQDSQYTILPSGNGNDGQKKEAFGEIKDAFESNQVKPYDFEVPTGAPQGQAGATGSNFGQPVNRTVDVF